MLYASIFNNGSGGVPGNRSVLLFLSRRAHLLTTSSSQAPYPSPRRKRQVSLIPLLLLSPQSQKGFAGTPPGGGIPPSGRAVRSARRIALSAESARQCCRSCSCGHHCLREETVRRFSTCENLPPAALSQRPGRSFLTFPGFLFCERETEKDWR